MERMPTVSNLKGGKPLLFRYRIDLASTQSFCSPLTTRFLRLSRCFTVLSLSKISQADRALRVFECIIYNKRFLKFSFGHPLRGGPMAWVGLVPHIHEIVIGEPELLGDENTVDD
jgi:hypothetical protein